MNYVNTQALRSCRRIRDLLSESFSIQGESERIHNCFRVRSQLGLHVSPKVIHTSFEDRVAQSRRDNSAGESAMIWLFGLGNAGSITGSLDGPIFHRA